MSVSWDEPKQSMFCLSLADFYSSHCPPQLHEIKKSSWSDGRRAPFLFKEFLLTWFYVPKWVRALIVQSAGINCCCSVSQKKQKKKNKNKKTHMSTQFWWIQAWLGRINALCTQIAFTIISTFTFFCMWSIIKRFPHVLHQSCCC